MIPSIRRNMTIAEEILPPGDPAPELLEGRLWVDGCFDFFHHGEPPEPLSAP